MVCGQCGFVADLRPDTSLSRRLANLRRSVLAVGLGALTLARLAFPDRVRARYATTNREDV
jgi:hypothetical protein